VSLEDEERRIAQLRATAHPLRIQMLSLLTGTALSAAELGRELGTSQALASYHLRRLADAGLVELAEERSHRGGQERRYRYVHVALDWQPPAADAEGHALLIDTMVGQLRERSSRRSATSPGLTVDAELWVRPEDWLAARDAVADATARLHEQARPPHEPGTVRVATSVLMFPLEDPS
jgi:DNA-binding transcriptional ArsR family regulator